MSVFESCIMGMAILAGIGYNLVSTEIFKDDPSTWICKNKTFKNPEVIKAAMDACQSRPGACKNLCVFQTLGVLDGQFQLNEEKTKSQIAAFFDGNVAAEVGAKFIPCRKSLKVNDTDEMCAGNHEFLTCARKAVTEVMFANGVPRPYGLLWLLGRVKVSQVPNTNDWKGIR